MKRILTITLSIILALLTAALFPAKVFADSLPDYVSDVKAFYTEYPAKVKDGYTILTDSKGNPVDLNKDAGGGWGSKGDRAVYLGYKTTKDSKEAITDLALMNMKGDYDVAEYEALMDLQLRAQILPFIDNFRQALAEYRENYNSNGANKQRAEYICALLNKLIDDDTGMPLGDLFLNETKEELGDEAYNALSDEQKKQHADLATIIAQANGQATAVIFNLITRAADTNEESWIDRFVNITYDDLIEQTGLSPTDARREVTKLFDDKAQTILDMWEPFREQLLSADEAEAYLDEYDEDAVNEVLERAEQASEDELAEMAEELLEVQKKETEKLECERTLALKDYLEGFDYGDGTLYDFFTMDSDDIADDITVLYPLVASLSNGQAAGLDYVSLSEYVCLTGINPEEYYNEVLDDTEAASIYEGVDRAIYQKGGVALTGDAVRKNISEEIGNADKLSKLTISLAVISGICAVGFAVSLTFFIRARSFFNNIAEIKKGFIFGYYEGGVPAFKSLQTSYTYASKFGGYFAVGLGVAMIVLSAVTVHLAWKDMKAYYKVDFTPIPHYMISETDLIGYNSKGEKIVLKNQSAYYKAVECNRKQDEEAYEMLGTCADMNGDVGRQWLALYAVKKENMPPILADSFKVVVDSSDVPSGYTTGIHMFGSSAAFNLNSSLYDWNTKAKSVYIYYKTDDSAPTATGSNFTGGAVAITGGAGFVIGALATALGMTNSRKKKNENEAA